MLLFLTVHVIIVHLIWIFIDIYRRFDPKYDKNIFKLLIRKWKWLLNNTKYYQTNAAKPVDSGEFTKWISAPIIYVKGLCFNLLILYFFIVVFSLLIAGVCEKVLCFVEKKTYCIVFGCLIINRLTEKLLKCINVDGSPLWKLGILQ